jgi:N-hydroxyarylamine O-acetyltransferase
MLSVPFENLDIHLGRRNVLDPAANVAKIVDRRRGGWCYELNGSFAELLQALGFGVTLLGAAVYGERGLTDDLAHLALRVDLDGAWLVDVGFGDSFTTPVELDAPLEQQRDGSRYRCVADADHLVLERDGEPSYRFSLQPRSIDDFAAMSEYQQTSPQSVFTTRRMCSLATETGRITLTDLRLVETRDGRREERDLAGEGEWRSILAERFGVVLDA